MSMGCDTTGTSHCDPIGWKVRLGWCQTVPVQRGREGVLLVVQGCLVFCLCIIKKLHVRN